MKKAAALLLALFILFALVSCGEEKGSAGSVTIKDANGEKFDYPEENHDNFTESENESGMRFTLTLHNYTDNFNLIYYELGGDSDRFSYTKWKKAKKDDKKYEYFYLKSGIVTLTATIEKESLCLVNVGCGVSGEDYEKNERNRDRVLKVSAVCAAASGGYETDDIEFFTALFKEVENLEEHNLWFNDAVYHYEKSGEKNSETVLFRVMPTSEEKCGEWSLTRV